MTHPQKLIEVALPLDDINRAASREKSIRHGHPSTLHLWWARRPLAAARAVLFAQLVDDPDEERFPGVEERKAERERLFDIIRELVKWENTTNEKVLERARREIRASWRRACEANRDHPRAAELYDPEKLPAFHDPFAGGGTIPLEAQRLGMEAHASDLNPVAVLINKAMIEIPPRFAGQPPVHPEAGSGSLPGRKRSGKRTGKVWPGATGLAEDVRRYGGWMREEAAKRIGHLYPKVEITAAMVRERPDLAPYEGESLTVIAWLWARTVGSPNPAFRGVEVPLASSFVLSSKRGKEAWVEPVIGEDGRSYRFRVRVGIPPVGAKAGTSAGKRRAFRCLLSGIPVTYNHIRAEGQAGRMGARLLAVVAQGKRARVYLSPLGAHESAARRARPSWTPNMRLPDNPRDFKTPNYGLKEFADLFTPRQLVALTTFSDLVGEARDRVRRDAIKAGLPDDGVAVRNGGSGATAYAEAVSVYLACALSKVANIGSSIASWMSDRGAFRETFARQAIPMMWDFAEANPFARTGGSLETVLKKGAMVVSALPVGRPGAAVQVDAASLREPVPVCVSTDPPYYDNIGYADLSDFFYVWLRRSLSCVFPELFATLGTPKADELVATPYRHGSGKAAESFFLTGMTKAVRRMAERSHPYFPVTIYYAFKQSERKSAGGRSSTGWETFLDAVIRSGFSVFGTWPMRTEGAGRILARGTNALASSIIMVCRRRPDDAPDGSRREFVIALRAELPPGLRLLQSGNVAPVDLQQAAIGPGMAVYTRYGTFRPTEPARTSARWTVQVGGATAGWGGGAGPLPGEPVTTGATTLPDWSPARWQGGFGRVCRSVPGPYREDRRSPALHREI